MDTEIVSSARKGYLSEQSFPVFYDSAGRSFCQGWSMAWKCGGRCGAICVVADDFYGIYTFRGLVLSAVGRIVQALHESRAFFHGIFSTLSDVCNLYVEIEN